MFCKMYFFLQLSSVIKRWKKNQDPLEVYRNLSKGMYIENILESAKHLNDRKIQSSSLGFYSAIPGQAILRSHYRPNFVRFCVNSVGFYSRNPIERIPTTFDRSSIGLMWIRWDPPGCDWPKMLLDPYRWA
jgi:hypothetical protein